MHLEQKSWESSVSSDNSLMQSSIVRSLGAITKYPKRATIYCSPKVRLTLLPLLCAWRINSIDSNCNKESRSQRISQYIEIKTTLSFENDWKWVNMLLTPILCNIIFMVGIELASLTFDMDRIAESYLSWNGHYSSDSGLDSWWQIVRKRPSHINPATSWVKGISSCARVRG